MINRDCIVNNILDHIKNDIVGINRNSAQPIKANTILLPVGGKDNNNKSLQSKDNTLQWAKRIQSQVNREYQSQHYGNLININNDVPNGTIIDITIPSRLIDAYE